VGLIELESDSLSSLDYSGYQQSPVAPQPLVSSIAKNSSTDDTQSSHHAAPSDVEPAVDNDLHATCEAVYQLSILFPEMDAIHLEVLLQSCHITINDNFNIHLKPRLPSTVAKETWRRRVRCC